MKKFWKKTEGFTLVELIVVIAILGILAGVGTVGYSGYVKKANMAADQALIGEVKQALELYYYSHPGTASGYVILDQEGKTVQIDDPNDDGSYDDSIGFAAIAATFGENWEDTVFLKYDGWQGESSTLTYKETTYYGHESELMNTIDSLTSALGECVEDPESAHNIIGPQFEAYLDKYNVDIDNGKAVGNAAVLYVAEHTKGEDNKEKILTAFSAGLNPALINPSDPVNSIVWNLYNSMKYEGFTDTAALAAVYAYAEGYAQYTGQASEFHVATTEGFRDVPNAPVGQTANVAVEALADSFASLASSPDAMSTFNEYAAEQGVKDLKGYVDMMGTVYNNQNIVSDNLNAEDCFTDGVVESMLKGHAEMGELNIATTDGQVAVILVVNGDGTIMSHVAPLNWNR